jgi:hypothetical protein
MTPTLEQRAEEVCYRCKVKPRVSYDSYCLEHSRERHRIRSHTPEYRSHEIAYMRKRRQMHNEKDLARNRRNARNQYLKHPEKVKARSTLRHAVTAGKIHKPSACSTCGKESKRIEGHHHLGYDRPFDVKWLCDPCHRITHRALASGSGEGK